MAVRATVSRFPVTQDALDACGVQWGISVTPFAAADERGQPPAAADRGDRLPRCERCWAYFNTYCDVERWGWACALCGTLNGFDDDAARRYQRAEDRPELTASFVDFEIPGTYCRAPARLPAPRAGVLRFPVGFPWMALLAWCYNSSDPWIGFGLGSGRGGWPAGAACLCGGGGSRL
jgi:hypothetical protein